MQILNYQLTAHFEERMRIRHLSEFLISLCLVKGEIKAISKAKKEYSLNQQHLLDAINQGYLSITECLSVKKIVVIAKKNLLITTYATYGDTGVNYSN